MYSRSSGVIKLVSIFLFGNIFSVLKNMSDTEETLEAPKEKKPRSVKQQETVKVARAKKAELDHGRLEEKERLKAEARFDKLLTLFEKVRVEEPPPPTAVIKKRQPVARKTEPEDEELEKPKVKATANPDTNEVFLRFC